MLPHPSITPAPSWPGLPKPGNDNFRVPPGSPANDNWLPKGTPRVPGRIPLVPVFGLLFFIADNIDGEWPRRGSPRGPGPGWRFKHGPNRYDWSFYNPNKLYTNRSSAYIQSGFGPQTGVISGQAYDSTPYWYPPNGSATRYSHWYARNDLIRGAQAYAWERSTQVSVKNRVIIPIPGPGDLEIFPWPIGPAAQALAPSLLPWLPVPPVMRGLDPRRFPDVAPHLPPWQRPIGPYEKPDNRHRPPPRFWRGWTAPAPFVPDGDDDTEDAVSPPVKAPHPAPFPPVKGIDQRPHVKNKPGRNTKENKSREVFPGLIGVLMNKFGEATELADFINAAWSALPHERKNWSFHNGKPIKPSVERMLPHLYENWQYMDADDFFKNVIRQQIEDAVIGSLSSANVGSGGMMTTGWHVGIGQRVVENANRMDTQRTENEKYNAARKLPPWKQRMHLKEPK